ncbi:MAG: hypothetical protein B7X90_01835 [Novosphingobium sp. 17-62-19]|uniref:hypothetical protein n=1 Tax=Novosphingobium sp. 17-62-19 TaxID=1970406 RepID=UPI000BD4B168|nr:hypothetical protein [Novosphingobium sp. 17-62-19]OZA21378.1 MAG: hypothetical protein B7X90_01835 [Novosphingobium sp. 17-62-19]HQS95077.1 hypothetical protein [Novosphingobium sp.]
MSIGFDVEGIDLDQARAMAERGDGDDKCRVRRRWLRQAVLEIERGRWAMAQLRAGGIDPELLDYRATPGSLGMTK